MNTKMLVSISSLICLSLHLPQNSSAMQQPSQPSPGYLEAIAAQQQLTEEQLNAQLREWEQEENGRQKALAASAGRGQLPQNEEEQVKLAIKASLRDMPPQSLHPQTLAQVPQPLAMVDPAAAAAPRQSNLRFALLLPEQPVAATQSLGGQMGVGQSGAPLSAPPQEGPLVLRPSAAEAAVTARLEAKKALEQLAEVAQNVAQEAAERVAKAAEEAQRATLAEQLAQKEAKEAAGIAVAARFEVQAVATRELKIAQEIQEAEEVAKAAVVKVLALRTQAQKVKKELEKAQLAEQSAVEKATAAQLKEVAAIEISKTAIAGGQAASEAFQQALDKAKEANKLNALFKTS